MGTIESVPAMPVGCGWRLLGVNLLGRGCHGRVWVAVPILVICVLSLTTQMLWHELKGVWVARVVGLGYVELYPGACCSLFYGGGSFFLDARFSPMGREVSVYVGWVLLQRAVSVGCAAKTRALTVLGFQMSLSLWRAVFAVPARIRALRGHFSSESACAFFGPFRLSGDRVVHGKGLTTI